MELALLPKNNRALVFIVLLLEMLKTGIELHFPCCELTVLVEVLDNWERYWILGAKRRRYLFWDFWALDRLKKLWTISSSSRNVFMTFCTKSFASTVSHMYLYWAILLRIWESRNAISERSLLSEDFTWKSGESRGNIYINHIITLTLRHTGVIQLKVLTTLPILSSWV